MNSSTDTAPEARPPRILSVDALRGFDMFWIIGGEHVAKALEKVSDGPVVAFLATQLQHVEWEGFHFYDGIFPLFLFLIGVSIVLSMDRMIVKVGRRGALWRIAQRSLLLFVIGVFYYGGLTQAWPDIHLSGVLPRIALCYLVAASLYVLLPRQGIVAAAALCLVSYWTMLAWVPFPDVNLKHDSLGKKGSQAMAKTSAELFPSTAPMTHGIYEEGRNLTHYADARWLPGRKRNLYYTNEGLLSTIPAVATSLFGIMAGWLITSKTLSDKRKVALLLGAGAASMALGYAWGLPFPVIKRLWTSSFCLVASGLSAILLGLFYLVVDVWRKQRWCLPFLWIGSNALVIYLAVNLVDFQMIATRLVGGDVQQLFESRLGAGFGGLFIAVTALTLPVLIVRFLYQKKIFIRL